MAEKKGVGHAYNVDFLNMVFAASSLFLFLSIIWMVWDDYDREWKTTQRRFAQLEYRVTQAQLQETTTGLDRNKLQQLEAARQAAEKIVAANQEEVDELEAALKAADARLYRATVDYQYAKATYDQDRYDFEASRANKTPGTSKTEPVVEQEAKALADLNLQVEQITAEKGELQRQLAQYTGQATALGKQVDDLSPTLKKRRNLDKLSTGSRPAHGVARRFFCVSSASRLR